jgi:amidophosphoribosyltransferase
MVSVQGTSLSSRFLSFDRNTTPARQCIFELVYFARPDSIVFNEDVYQCRKRMGAEIAREAPTEADFVMPFPDSGVYSAVGFARESGRPYEHAMIRNHYVGRTFIQPSQGMRDFGVRVKINPVRSMIKGKRICIVDDSIVRGTTIHTRVRKLRELGAVEIHFRVSCPPIKFPCFYGINFPSKGELIAANYTVQEIERFIGLDSLRYLSVDGMLRAVGNPDAYCLACFTGDYPVPCAGAGGASLCGTPA